MTFSPRDVAFYQELLTGAIKRLLEEDCGTFLMMPIEHAHMGYVFEVVLRYKDGRLGLFSEDIRIDKWYAELHDQPLYVALLQGVLPTDCRMLLSLQSVFASDDLVACAFTVREGRDTYHRSEVFFVRKA